MLDRPVSFGHLSYAFNAHVDSSGAVVQASLQNTNTIEQVRRTPRFRALIDPLHVAQGAALGRVHKNAAYLQMAGRIIVPDASQAVSIDERKRAFLAAFDPYLCYIDSPSTDGQYALDYDELTSDTATYPGGVIPLRQYCRPVEAPSVDEIRRTRSALPWTLVLVAGDPRSYEQTEQTLALTPASASGSLTNRGTVPGPMKLVIVTSANGSATFTVTINSVDLVLDLSAVGAVTITVVGETSGPYGRGKLITKGSAEAFSLKTSDASSWPIFSVGLNDISIANTTGITSCTVHAYSARA